MMTEMRRLPQNGRTKKSLSETTQVSTLADESAQTRTRVLARPLAFMLTLLLTFALTLSLVLALLPLTPALAANTEDILVTGYSITKGSTVHYTGAL
ncbi:MAG: hypothetical protein LBK67_10370, partial [Coriobacteriales bacterium]|nr:hypothetical protein [Coriobacteriales bacterium]